MSEMSIGQLGHHIGLHVSANVQGKSLGGEIVADERWIDGVIIGMGALGDYVTIELDEPVGHDKRVAIDDPSKIRPHESPAGVPQEVIDLWQRGKQVQAIRRYRELNGATLDEARAAIAQATR
jgi:hypothetical protein